MKCGYYSRQVYLSVSCKVIQEYHCWSAKETNTYEYISNCNGGFSSHSDSFGDSKTDSSRLEAK